MATDQTDINGYLTEELVIQILLRLPIASCIARFRSVCKSWRSLLSDSQFIRQIIFFQNSSPHPRLLIKRLRHDRSVYSLLSHDTLLRLPSSPDEEDLPSVPCKVRWPNGTSNLSIVGSCNGIFCLADGNSDGASDIILWNPETSETKLLPVSPFAHLRGFVVWGQLERIGFGFDPVTNDYKVVRTLQFSPGDDDFDHRDGNSNSDNGEEELEENNEDGTDNSNSDDGEEEELEENSEDRTDFDHPDGNSNSDDGKEESEENNEEELETMTSEVYSLRNNSWRKLEGGSAHGLFYSIPQCCDGKFYWWDDGQEDRTDFLSFDMSSEVFEATEVANPTQMSSGFSIRSVSMVKGSAVAIFSDMETVEVANSLEIWVMLKLGVAAGTWTKLWTVTSSPQMKCVHPVGIWTSGQCFLQRYDNGELIVLDPETGNITELKVEGEWQFFQVVPHAPSRVSLLDFA